MKKLLLLIVLVAIAGLVMWKLFSGKEAKSVEEPKDQPLALSSKSSAFDISLSKLLTEYYGVRDALVDWDSAKADISAKALEIKADSLSFKGLKGDSAIILTAENLASSLSNEVKGFLGENSLEQKRRSFNMMTEYLYNLIRTVQYGGNIVYHLKCPMAFNDTEEAYWLSNDNKIVNPYLGNKHPKYKNKMLECGSVVDSLSFEKK